MKKPDIRTYFASPGFVIRDPRSKQRVPHEGEGNPIRVHFSSFWARREADGSVCSPTVTEPAPATAKRSTKTTTEG
jgi:hypothetical protein